ncbi:MAG: hypothetical protein ABW219_17980 [Ilumatobacteraceae bacterium]
MAWWAGIGLAAAALVAVTPPTAPTTPTTPTVPAVPLTIPATVPPTVLSTVPISSSVPASSVGEGQGDADVLGCDAALFDPAHELDADQVERAIRQTAAVLGADVHVRAERTLDAGLDARMAQLEASCPTWTVSADRAPDLVVVMYSAVEREASVFYGADLGFELDDRWEPAVDAMSAQFQAGDFTGGVVDGLEVLNERATVPFTDTADDSDDTDSAAAADEDEDEDESSSEGLPGIVWLGIVGVAALLIYNIARYLRTGEWGDEGGGGGDGDGDGDDWSSSRRRTFGGFGSSSRRSSSSSSSSRRRSSSSSRSSSSNSTRRRSGGGSKKW